MISKTENIRCSSNSNNAYVYFLYVAVFNVLIIDLKHSKSTRNKQTYNAQRYTQDWIKKIHFFVQSNRRPISRPQCICDNYTNKTIITDNHIV